MRHLALVGQRQVDGLDLLLQRRDVGEGWADEQNRDRPGFDGPGELTQLAYERGIGQPIGHQIGAEVAQDVQTGLGLSDVLQDRDGVLNAGDRALADTHVRPGHLAQPLSSAPDEQAFRFVAVKAGNGSHEAAEAAFLERGDRDQRVSGPD